MSKQLVRLFKLNILLAIPSFIYRHAINYDNNFVKKKNIFYKHSKITSVSPPPRLLNITLDIVHSLFSTIFHPLSNWIPLNSIKPVDSFNNFVVPNIFHRLLEAQAGLVLNWLQGLNLGLAMVVNNFLRGPELARNKIGVFSELKSGEVRNGRSSQNT